MNISIQVAGKTATAIGAPVIVCGNSDYKLAFNFDTSWETFDVKTVRFVYKKGGKYEYIDKVFSGAEVDVPTLFGIDEVLIGVYSGDLHTTTPARITCKKSILCDDSTKREEPDPDVYRQLLSIINNLETLPTPSATDAGKVLTVNAAGSWVARQPDTLKDLNSGKLFKVFSGTFDEWEKWTGDKTGVTFVPTGSTIEDAIRDAVTGSESKLVSGETVVAKADRATIADTATRATSANAATTATSADYASRAGYVDATEGIMPRYVLTYGADGETLLSNVQLGADFETSLLVFNILVRRSTNGSQYHETRVPMLVPVVDPANDLRTASVHLPADFNTSVSCDVYCTVKGGAVAVHTENISSGHLAYPCFDMVIYIIPLAV